MYNQCQGSRIFNEQDSCFCPCHIEEKFLSKKKKIEVLRHYLDKLEDKVEDIKEYIKELDSSD